MATSTKRSDYRRKASGRQQMSALRFKSIFQIKRTAVLMFLISALTFVTALYYVDQQIRLRKLNYEIIALKYQKKVLVEDRKTLQLQLDQLKRLGQIEAEMRRRGFVPVEEQQIRIVLD